MKLKRTLQALTLSAIVGAPTIVLASGCGSKAQFRKPPVFVNGPSSITTDQSGDRPAQHETLPQNIVTQNTKEWNDYQTKLAEARMLSIVNSVFLPAVILDEASRLSITSSVEELRQALQVVQTWIDQVKAQVAVKDPIVTPPAQNPVVTPPTHDPIVTPPTHDPIVNPPAQNPIVNPPAQNPIVTPPTHDPIVNPPAQNPIVNPPAQNPVVTPPAQNPPANGQSHAPVVIDQNAIRSLMHISGNNGFGSLDAFTSPNGLTIVNETAYRQGMLLNGDVVILKITSTSGEIQYLKYTVTNLPTVAKTQSPTYTPSQYMASGSKVTYTLTVENVNGVNRDSMSGEDYRIADITPDMWHYDIGSTPHEEYWKNFTGRKYTITGIGDAKFAIWFDHNSHTDQTIERKMIDKFINETNWGVGLLSLRNIFFVDGSVGSPGVAGKASSLPDIVVSLNDITPKGIWDTDDDVREQWRNVNLQRSLANLQHEYGHHETLTMYMSFNNYEGTVGTMRRALIKYHALAADIAAKVVQAEGGNEQPMNDLIDAYVAKMKTLPSFSQIIGDAFGDGSLMSFSRLPDDQIRNNHFAFKYQFSSEEYLNRFINAFELTNLFDDDQLLRFPTFTRNELYQTTTVLSVMIPYAFANEPIIDANRVYTQKALDTYDLYTKYVYGFNNPNPRKRLLIDNFALRGYSPTEFDFLRLLPADNRGVVGEAFGNLAGASTRKDTVKIRKVPTHFFTRHNVFGPKQFVDTNGFAYFAATENIVWVSPDTFQPKLNNQEINPNIIHAYRDSNHNGVLDQNDADVTDELKQVSNWSADNYRFNSNDDAE